MGISSVNWNVFDQVRHINFQSTDSVVLGDPRRDNACPSMRGEKRLTLDKNSLIFLTKGGDFMGRYYGRWAVSKVVGNHRPASGRAMLSSRRAAIHLDS